MTLWSVYCQYFQFTEEQSLQRKEVITKFKDVQYQKMYQLLCQRLKEEIYMIIYKFNHNTTFEIREICHNIDYNILVTKYIKWWNPTN